MFHDPTVIDDAEFEPLWLLFPEPDELEAPDVCDELAEVIVVVGAPPMNTTAIPGPGTETVHPLP